MAELTNKQRVFVEAYLACGFNASEAARRAGYAKPGQQGHRLLKNVEIGAVIRQELADRAMPADEVLARLAEHARGTMADFIRVNEKGVPEGFDLSKNAPQHLIKKVSITDKGITFELYDAQAALIHLGKHHGLFTADDNDDWRKALEQMGINAADFFGQLVSGLKQAPSQGSE